MKWLEERVSALSGSPKTIGEGRDRALPGEQPSPPLVRTSTPARTPSQPWETSERSAVADEIAGVNHHTQNQEFYGSSSSVALLARVGRSPPRLGDNATASRDEQPDAFLSSLHNPVYSQQRADGIDVGRSSVSSFPRCRVFIDGFFSTLHYIFPILDKALFMRRCENLWASEGSTEKSSFVALYFSVLSLGALVGPRSEDLIDGQDNLAWSRKFFEESRSLCSALGMVTDLEMVQCYFFLVRPRPPRHIAFTADANCSPRCTKMS